MVCILRSIVYKASAYPFFPDDAKKKHFTTEYQMTSKQTYLSLSVGIMLHYNFPRTMMFVYLYEKLPNDFCRLLFFGCCFFKIMDTKNPMEICFLYFLDYVAYCFWFYNQKQQYEVHFLIAA